MAAIPAAFAPAAAPPAALAYVRVSTTEQAERSYGLDLQRERIVAYCRAERLPLAGFYEDAGASGTTPLEARAGLAAALNTAQAAEHGAALVVARHDRLARDPLQALLTTGRRSVATARRAMR